MRANAKHDSDFYNRRETTTRTRQQQASAFDAPLLDLDFIDIEGDMLAREQAQTFVMQNARFFD